MTSINLHEDNAGGLYLYQPSTGTVWAGLQNVRGASFAEDAAAIEAGDTADWNLDTYPASEIEDVPCVASFHRGLVSDWANGGSAAKSYLHNYNQ